MTHVDDLYEPGDDREPGEPEQEAPLDLDEVEAAHEQALIELDESWAVGEENTELVLRHMLPKVLAELRDARQQLAEWGALPVREEWAVTPGRQQVPQEFDFRFPDGLTAEEAAKRQGRQTWRRQSSVRSWEPIDYAPF